MMSGQDRQILIAVDLFSVVSVDELENKLPVERHELRVLRLTDFGAPVLAPPGPNQSPIPWPALGRAVETLVAKVLELCSMDSRPVVVFTGGQGPLPVFVHLGYALSKFAPRQVFLNRHYGSSAWEAFRLDAPPESEGPLLDRQSGFPVERAMGTGRVALYIDTAGRPAPIEAIRDLLTEQGDAMAGLVEMRSTKALTVTPDNATALALELTQAMARVCAIYPYQSGLAVFVAGPILLAFLLGHALNPSIVQSVYLTNFNAGKYELVYALPFAEQKQPAISHEPSDQLKRKEVLDTFIEAVGELCDELKPEHLPTDVLNDRNREKFVARLRELGHRPTDKEDFHLSVAQGQYAFGVGLLEALRRSTTQQQKDFAKLFLLHELLHDWQGIRSTNHFDAGRAGVVLEQVDFAADVFALRIVNRVDVEGGGPRAAARVREILRRWLETALHGVEAFDLMEQGPRMNRLAERRLRRYLIWHLQLARASTVRTGPDVEALLSPPVTVELAPVAGRIDPQRHEKEVLHALPNTELFCAVGGQLVREAKRPGFDPGQLIEAVRTYSHAPIQQAMQFLVEQHKHKLASWLP